MNKATSSLEFHEAANLFPLDEEHVAELAEDIKANGQQVPIELCDGKIIDGRRRYTACQRIGVEPKTIDVHPADPVTYVLSLNLHRRHLTKSQRAMVAARARDMHDRQARERMRSGGKRHSEGVEKLPHLEPVKARDAAGKAVDVSGRMVDYATKVLEQGTPELVKAVDEGRVAVHRAAAVAGEPAEKQRCYVSAPRPKRTPATPDEPAKAAENPTVQGVGVTRANEAINCLIRIPKNDALRKRGFQLVTDWIRANGSDAPDITPKAGGSTIMVVLSRDPARVAAVLAERFDDPTLAGIHRELRKFVKATLAQDRNPALLSCLERMERLASMPAYKLSVTELRLIASDLKAAITPD